MNGVAYYDLAYNPPSYNVVDFLLGAEEWRLKEGLEKISVVVIPGPFGGFKKTVLPPTGHAVRARWRDNIVMPMPELLPSCGKPAILSADHSFDGPTMGRGESLHGFSSLLHAASIKNYPFVVPERYRALAVQKYGLKYVTITERSTGYWIERTTNLAEWRKVAHELEKQGYRVVLIPDGSKEPRDVEGFDSDADIGRHVLDRAGVYSKSSMNFGIPSGPMWLSWFLGAPTIICKMINEFEPSTQYGTFVGAGLHPGSQLPNAKSRQCLLWKPERAKDILDAFERAMSDKPCSSDVEYSKDYEKVEDIENGDIVLKLRSNGQITADSLWPKNCFITDKFLQSSSNIAVDDGLVTIAVTNGFATYRRGMIGNSGYYYTRGECEYITPERLDVWRKKSV